MAENEPPKLPQRMSRNRLAREQEMLAAVEDQRGEGDAVDKEIDAALAEGRPIDMAEAFPDPPMPLKPVRARTRTPKADTGARFMDAPLHDNVIAVRKGEEDSPETQERIADRLNPLRTTTVTPTDDPEQDDVVPPMPGSDAQPGNRLQQVARIAPSYKTEFRLRLLYRLLMRGLPLDMIASQMQMSVKNVQKLRAQLYQRLKAEAETYGWQLYMGKTDAFYNEVRSIAMRMADETPTQVKDQNGRVIKEVGATRGDRLRALSVALDAEASRQRFYHVSGVFAAMPFKPSVDQDQVDHAAAASRVIDMISAVMGGGDVETFFAPDDSADGDDEEVSLTS